MDWIAWHDRYETNPCLAERLSIVRMLIRESLEAVDGAGQLSLVSVCAGDGRDVVGALAGTALAGRVSGVLVEIDPVLAGRAREALRDASLDGLDVIEGDAGTTSPYEGRVPADLVLLCGVFGNIPDDEVEGTLSALPMFCRLGASVVWTRHRGAPDLTPAIRRWFARGGFDEAGFWTIPNSSASVGRHVFSGTPQPLQPGVRLFEFAAPR